MICGVVWYRLASVMQYRRSPFSLPVPAPVSVVAFTVQVASSSLRSRNSSVNRFFLCEESPAADAATCRSSNEPCCASCVQVDLVKGDPHIVGAKITPLD